MKYIKHLFIALLLVQCTFVNAQRGFKVLAKAEKQYEKGNYEKTLKLLDKVDNMSDESFKDSHIDTVKRKITWLKASAYIEMKEYQLARNTIETSALRFFKIDYDSLYMVSYRKEYGTDYLRTQIQKTIKNDDFKTIMICRIFCSDEDSYKRSDDTCIASFTLENGEIIIIPFSIYGMLYDIYKEDEIKMMIKEDLLKSRNYQLLTQKLN